LGHSMNSPRRFWLPLVAICLPVCAQPARAQEFATAPYGQSNSGVPANAPLQLQQSADTDNFPMTDPAVGGTSPFVGKPQQSEWPQWYVTAESLFLWRDNRYPSTLVGDFDVGVGPRVFAGVRPDGDWELQAGYFGAFGMETGRTYPYSDYFNLDLNSISLTSELNNAEVNLLGNFDDFAFLTGFRYVGFNDAFDFRIAQYDVYHFGGEYRTTVTNNLYGGQLGLRFRHVWERFAFEATGKAGIFGNHAQGDGFFAMHETGDARRYEFPNVVGDKTAFVGDLNFTAGYRVSPSWSARAGYNLIWINDVALAPDRVDFDNEPRAPLDMQRRVFMHGANVGLEAVW
jgi:putative beta barrel porin BBP7